MSLADEHRKEFHTALLAGVLTVDDSGVPNIADKGSKASKAIAQKLIEKLGRARVSVKAAGQTSGADFETVCSDYVKRAFGALSHLRPGDFVIEKGRTISAFDQYQHLNEIEKIAKASREISTAIGSDYLISPDVLIWKKPVSDAQINASADTVGHGVASHTPFREASGANPTLHASISCKWTLRSDRAQNARSEGLNLVRNRKGKLPHVVIITAEPTPNRIASLALGTGDIDCVYHIALPELQETLAELENETASEMLAMMVEGRRVRDIADLPFDLII